MIQPLPARPGMTESEIDTPALILDLDAFEANLDVADRMLRGTGMRLRPHAKTHKSAVIATIQKRRGAVGQCVQKVAEAEALAWAGCDDILVSNEVVGDGKLARLAALGRIARISVCVDSASQVAALDLAAKQAGVNLGVLVEIDVGGNRCGAAPGDEALSLAKIVAGSEHLDFLGLQAYQGSAQHLRTSEERRLAIDHAARAASRTADLLRENGIDCQTIAGGGTGSFLNEIASGVYNELQLGSYLFMDADYARNRDESGAPVSLFCQSLFVLTTVMSSPREDVAVLDAGHKAVPIDSGLPLVWNRPGLSYADASDEHGTLAVEPETARPQEGEKLRLVPSHCDPTVDRYDWYVCVRNGRVECLWPVTARGAMT